MNPEFTSQIQATSNTAAKAHKGLLCVWRGQGKWIAQDERRVHAAVLPLRDVGGKHFIDGDLSVLERQTRGGEHDTGRKYK